jgi:hypothetical protein
MAEIQEKAGDVTMKYPVDPKTPRPQRPGGSKPVKRPTRRSGSEKMPPEKVSASQWSQGVRPVPPKAKKPAPGSVREMPRRIGQKPAKPVEMPKRTVPKKPTKPAYRMIGGKKVSSSMLKMNRGK